MNAMTMSHPWPLSFSYARALQAPALEAWRGKPENVTAGQRALLHRARCNAAASLGRYTPEMELEGRDTDAILRGLLEKVEAPRQ